MKVPGWARVALAFAGYATALALVPAGWWRAAPWLWSGARVVPYWAGAGLCVVAWATKDDAPGEGGSLGAPTPSARGGRAAARSTPSPAPAQVAAVLSASACLDVALVLGGGGPWWVAWATSAATWGLVGGILARWLIRSCASPRT